MFPGCVTPKKLLRFFELEFSQPSKGLLIGPGAQGYAEDKVR